MSEIHDFVQLATEGQVNPTAESEPGAQTILTLPAVAAQFSTQTNPSTPSYGLNSIVAAQQNLAVAGPTYSAAGSRLAP